MKILLIAIAGAIGTLARYFLSGFVQGAVFGAHKADFPWGTYAVNMAGCFLFGLVWPLAEERLFISPLTRTVLLVGFMGAFTTFSSYIFDTMDLIRGSHLILAFGNIALQNITGLAFLMLGVYVARLL